MTITYNKEANALYIKFKTEFVNDTAADASGKLYIDYAKDGSIVGIEVLNASQQLDIPLRVNYVEI